MWRKSCCIASFTLAGCGDDDKMSYANLIAIKRPAKTHRFDIHSPTLGRALTLYSHGQLAQWVLLEAMPRSNDFVSGRPMCNRKLAGNRFTRADAHWLDPFGYRALGGRSISTTTRSHLRSTNSTLNWSSATPATTYWQRRCTSTAACSCRSTRCAPCSSAATCAGTCADFL